MANGTIKDDVETAEKMQTKTKSIMEAEKKEIMEMNIYQRIHEISKLVTPLNKENTNEHHNYKYVSEVQVKELFKPLFEHYRIDFSFSINILDPKEGVQLGKMRIYNTGGFIYLTNIDNPVDALAYEWSCQGADSGDKAVLKAETSGLRHWLMNKFQIKTGLDVEADPGVDKNDIAFENDKEVLDLVEQFKKEKRQKIKDWIPTYQGSKKQLIELLASKLKGDK